MRNSVVVTCLVTSSRLTADLIYIKFGMEIGDTCSLIENPLREISRNLL